MIKLILRVSAATVAAMLIGSCSVMKIPKQNIEYVHVTSEPSDVMVMHGNTPMGYTPCDIPVTAMSNMNSKAADLVEKSGTVYLQFSKDGYLTKRASLKPVFNDKRSEYHYPGNLHVSLSRVKNDYDSHDAEARRKDPTIPEGESQVRVSRDKAGQSALERTVIRWYFDSDPRGARIFYRVISSVPAEVKNTNETYLMTTPFEETRSFNILGLTYENSRDVQIEIKVKKKGYEDQIKRYNVRQAIDQQEISGFFDLVKQE